jgi:hypothetical protein
MVTISSFCWMAHRIWLWKSSWNSHLKCSLIMSQYPAKRCILSFFDLVPFPGLLVLYWYWYWAIIRFK